MQVFELEGWLFRWISNSEVKVYNVNWQDEKISLCDTRSIMGGFRDFSEFVSWCDEWLRDYPSSVS